MHMHYYIEHVLTGQYGSDGANVFVSVYWFILSLRSVFVAVHCCLLLSGLWSVDCVMKISIMLSVIGGSMHH